MDGVDHTAHVMIDVRTVAGEDLHHSGVQPHLVGDGLAQSALAADRQQLAPRISVDRSPNMLAALATAASIQIGTGPAIWSARYEILECPPKIAAAVEASCLDQGRCFLCQGQIVLVGNPPKSAQIGTVLWPV